MRRFLCLTLYAVHEKRSYWSVQFCAGLPGFIATVTLKHLIDTPQPLESALPGEARLYRWRSGHIFYKVLGTPANPPLVLLHSPGIGASAHEMRHIMAQLSQQYHVYAPDLPGFGLSDRLNNDYTIDTYTDFCHDFLTEVVQIASHPATLLASGISCTYAVEVAHNFPDICERLVLISPIALAGTRHLPRAFSLLLRLPPFGLSLYTLCSTRSALRWLHTQRNPQYREKQGWQKGQRRTSRSGCCISLRGHPSLRRRTRAISSVVG